MASSDQRDKCFSLKMVVVVSARLSNRCTGCRNHSFISAYLGRACNASSTKLYMERKVERNTFIKVVNLLSDLDSLLMMTAAIVRIR